jgi:small subunit ribosomal protein S1
MDEKTINKEHSENEDFEKLLEGSFIKNDNFSVGDRVEGTVVFISDENVFVDISSKSEAVIDIQEFKDANDNLTINKGDRIEAYIVSMRGGEISLSASIGRGHTSVELLNKAYSFNIPVDGTVIDLIKGGYNISVSGIICFCPHSQIDLKAPSNPDALLNKKLKFRIVEFSERGKNIVLSRRILLEEERQKLLGELKDTLKEGDTVSGKIISIQDFGLFVDIGGIEALIPKSEISWSKRPELTSFNIGDSISSKIISTNWDNEKIVLSIKSLITEPWERIEEYSIGQSVNGSVVNIIKRGAFVEIEPGLEGYIPLSRMSLIRRVNKPEEVLSLGDNVNVKIIDINTEEKKILLQLLTDEPDPWLAPTDTLLGKINIVMIESTVPSGLSVRLQNGMAGFVPAGELTIKKGADIQRAYPAGKEIKVVVKDIIIDERKLILSERRALKLKEMEEFKEYMNETPLEGGENTTLGNVFRDKFDEIKKKLNND